MRVFALCLPLALLAAGCDRQHKASFTVDTSDDADKAGGDNRTEVRITDSGVAKSASGDAKAGSFGIDVPGFKAQISLPSIQLSGADTNLDGMKLFPGTQLTGMKVAKDGDDDNDDHGEATMTYTAKAAPAAVLAYYRSAAPAAGYKVDATGSDSVSGHKGGSARFSVTAHNSAGGSAGTITATGD